MIRVSRGRLQLIRASYFQVYQTVYGGFDEADWYYQLNIFRHRAQRLGNTTIVEADRRHTSEIQF